VLDAQNPVIMNIVFPMNIVFSMNIVFAVRRAAFGLAASGVCEPRIGCYSHRFANLWGGGKM